MYIYIPTYIFHKPKNHPFKHVTLWVLVQSQVVQPSSQSNSRTFSSSPKGFPYTTEIRSNYIYFTCIKYKFFQIKP